MAWRGGEATDLGVLGRHTLGAAVRASEYDRHVHLGNRGGRWEGGGREGEPRGLGRELSVHIR